LPEQRQRGGSGPEPQPARWPAAHLPGWSSRTHAPWPPGGNRGVLSGRPSADRRGRQRRVASRPDRPPEQKPSGKS